MNEDLAVISHEQSTVAGSGHGAQVVLTRSGEGPLTEEVTRIVEHLDPAGLPFTHIDIAIAVGCDAFRIVEVTPPGPRPAELQLRRYSALEKGGGDGILEGLVLGCSGQIEYKGGSPYYQEPCKTGHKGDTPAASGPGALDRLLVRGFHVLSWYYYGIAAVAAYRGVLSPFHRDRSSA